MKCPIETQEGKELLLSYASGTLDGVARAVFADHLRTCSACREFAAGQRAVWKALDFWDAPPVSADFDRRLYTRIESETSPRDSFARWLRPALLRRVLPVAAAAALVVAALSLHRRAPAPPMPASEPASVEKIEAGQVERALDDLEMLSRFDRALGDSKPESQI